MRSFSARAARFALPLICTGCTAIIGDANYSFSDPSPDAPTSAADGGLEASEAAADEPVADETGDPDAGGDAVGSGTANGDASDATWNLVPASTDAASVDEGADAPVPPDASNVVPPPGNRDAGNVVDASGSTDATEPTDGASPATDGGVADAGALMPESAVPCTACVEVLYENANPAPSSQGPEVSFELRNTGPKAVALATVTVRYYFTADGCALKLTGRCDAALLNNKATACPNVRFVSLPVPTPTADTYIEFQFAGTGTLAAATLGGFQGQGAYFAPSFACTFNQANDYSYSADAPVFALTTRMTAYVNGILVWGTEP